MVFSYSLDSNYSSGNNSTTQVTLDARGGTIALTSDIQQGVVAYGSNYVRFGDGTQICWGSCGNNSFSSFGAAFANTNYRIGMSEWKSSSWETMQLVVNQPLVLLCEVKIIRWNILQLDDGSKR